MSKEAAPKKRFQKISSYFPGSVIHTKPSKVTKSILFFIVLILAIIASIFFYLKYQEASTVDKISSSQGAPSKKVVDAFIAKVSRLIELPKGETPTIATVTDPAKLEGQVFFTNAKKGDKVLIYGSTQMAYLYRPATDKLINVAPINVNPEKAPNLAPTISATPAPSITITPTTAQKISIVLYNGTTKVGFTKTAETNLKAKNADIEVADRDNAASSTYTKTLIVDISGTHKVQADILANITGGSIASLPKGETKPAKGDILIILGSDYK